MGGVVVSSVEDTEIVVGDCGEGFEKADEASFIVDLLRVMRVN
jgi:hypothetical protein